MVGDSAADVDSAQGVGVAVVVTAYGYSPVPPHDLGADAVIDDFAELPGFDRTPLPGLARRMTILVTGAAGFIGFHVCKALVARGERVLGVDNMNDYYDVRLKEARLAGLQAHAGFVFARADIADREAMAAAIAPERQSITRIVHLAAQAGVRHSLVDPYAYVQANVMGQVVLLELCRELPALEHMSSTLAPAQSTAAWPRHRSRPMPVSIRRSPSMRRPRGQAS